MKIAATSDLHGMLPNPFQDIPECDVLLLAGDICPDFPSKHGKYYEPDNGAALQREWLLDTFEKWLTLVPAQRVIAIGGNHDFVFEHPSTKDVVNRLPWTYLFHQGVNVGGVSVFGTPFVPGLPRWAFHASQQAETALWEDVPEGIDILLSHGPPRGHLDHVLPRFGDVAVGSIEHQAYIERGGPRFNIFGHIHEQYGMSKNGWTTCVNVSYVDADYLPGRPVWTVDTEGDDW